ncbi:MAG: hypothetical protein HKO59_03565 [Phycisphaerales bacterium]|nr:hypothetical protein [Phycisphaerae bacterium]NNF41889.1 hypothetical protein [Phycisphaerales bacterium]NNM25059.1 hypothetical protein [Phycisphaerales bacterium]
MDKSRPAAERVRPILEAMERSVTAARQRRLHGGTPASTPTPPTPGTSTLEPPARDEETPTRLKARPKRATPYPSGTFR